MNKIIVFILFFPLFVYSQGFNSEVRVTYLLKSKEYKNSNKLKKQTYVLLAGDNQSFFQPTNTYILDSLKKQGKVSFENHKKFYDSNSQKKIIIDDTLIKVFEKRNNIVISYNESNLFNWNITNEHKKIGGVDCYKATITKFGRSWEAYYAPSYPLPFGPYKFNKLPGLIFELRDTETEFVFSIKKISKYQHPIHVVGEKGTKLLSKEEFFTTLYRLKLDNTLGGKIRVSPETARKMTVNVTNRLKNINFIERVPEVVFKD